MTELALVGIGTWSPKFANWQGFVSGLRAMDWPDDAALQPDLIPPRERRRAPQLVKMAVEVMHQACSMAKLKPDEVATVFSSAMGDMDITDYICRAVAQTPKLVSPTRFHNSVHNAAPGYWSIATGAFTPANAVSAFEYTPTMAFLEGAIQAVEEDAAVLIVTQEVAAPPALFDTCPSANPFSAAFLLMPASKAAEPLATVRFSVATGTCAWPQSVPGLEQPFGSNMSARLLPLMAEIAALQAGDTPRELRFPLSAFSAMTLSLLPPGSGRG